MHDQRLLACLLGLIVLVPTIVCRTCGTDFTDISSSALLAGVVFEGQVESTFASVNGRYNATFSVTKVLKGALPIPEGRKRPRPVEVGEFGPENAEACLTEVLIGSRYLVFVNSTSVSNYFVVTAFPGASTKKALRDIRSIVCTDCASLPKLRPLKVLKVVSGRKLRLRCRGTGKPSMLFTWYKDGVPLELRPGLTMRSTRKSSRLQIRHTKPEDAGVYKCSAANAMGVVDAQTSVTVEAGTGPKKPRTTSSTHYAECSKRGWSKYCMHGGTCLYTPDIKGAEPFCRCTPRFMGPRCEGADPRYILPMIENIQRKDWDRGMTLAGIIIGVIVLIAIFIAAFVMSKKRRKEAREKRLRKQQQRASENANSATYRPVSEGTVALNLAAPPPPSPKVRTASMTTQTDPVKISTPEAPHRNSGFPQIKRDSSSFSKLNGHRSPTPTEDSPKRIRLQGVSSSSSSSSSPEKTSPERQIVPVTVESDLEKHASSSQNSKTESIQGAPSDPIPINNGHVRPKSQNSNGYSKSSNGRVEADQLSDYENQNSDYEPEIDLKGLDLAMTPDLVGIARRCQSKSNSVASCNESSDNESSSSSSAGVSEGLLEHDRIHSLKNNEHTSDQDSAGNLSWDEYGNMTTPTGFGNPYALEDDIIDNSYLNHNASNRSPQHSKLDKDSWHLKDRLLDVKEDADPVAI